VEDGNSRAQYPALIYLLQQLRALPEQLPPRLAEILNKPIRNTRGEVVGELTVRDRSRIRISPAAVASV
jgi:L-asparaginase II